MTDSTEVRRSFCPSCRQWRWPSAFMGKSRQPHLSGMCRGCRKFLGAISHTRGKLTACESRKTKYARELGALMKQYAAYCQVAE